MRWKLQLATGRWQVALVLGLVLAQYGAQYKASTGIVLGPVSAQYKAQYKPVLALYCACVGPVQTQYKPSTGLVLGPVLAQ